MFMMSGSSKAGIKQREMEQGRPTTRHYTVHPFETYVYGIHVKVIHAQTYVRKKSKRKCVNTK